MKKLFGHQASYSVLQHPVLGYKVIRTDSAGIWALLFGPFWLLYNRMWFWVFRNPPTGYKYKHVKGLGKIPTPDGTNSETIRQTFEAVAAGQLLSQTEIAHYATDLGMYDKKGQPKSVTLNMTKRLMDNAWFYAGFVEYKPWGITRRRGQHQPLIDLETFENVQANYRKRTHHLSRSLTKQKFPLRGIVYCEACQKQMYACYAGGRNSHYGYYYCHNKDCSEYNKHIRREVFHELFKQHLLKLQPTVDEPADFETDMFSEWEKQSFALTEQQTENQQRLHALERQTDALIEKLANTGQVQALRRPYIGV